MSKITRNGQRLIFCKKRDGSHVSYDRYIGQVVILTNDADLSIRNDISYGKFLDGNTLAFYHSWVSPRTGFATWIKEHNL